MLTKIFLPLLVLITSFVNPDSFNTIRIEEFPPEEFKGIWIDSDDEAESLIIIDDRIKIYSMYSDWELEGELLAEDEQLFVLFYDGDESVRIDATEFTINEKSMHMTFYNLDDELVSMTFDLENELLTIGAIYSDEDPEYIDFHKIETSPLDDE